MDQLFATTLLLTLSAGSTGLFVASNQPTLASSFSANPMRASLLSSGAAESALATYLAQVELPSDSTLQTQEGEVVATDICVNLPNWHRPSDLAQTKQLEAMPMYGAALQSDPLAEMVKTWWSHNIFSFTTYGLSARTDPLYLSGVWTAIDDTWDCYSDNQPEQINQGELAEMWLLHHRLVNLVWQDEQYLATVEPVDTGLQLVQFPRRERGQGLPLNIVTTNGQALEVMSGDW
ncbi:hypothetical protein IQ273_24005 [Nodosilinea sp. LEGE 07298]|uniref:hypothetical protein n=1 Tax=Nodosilinea sp. LEGE 07298 TaxID=2777970 RepID=UPI00187E982E|nr:hypothetical protein [Nodosilinea sp. LEGE 07298]MBE9112461.1 hypothetical protein [Nodosilinea sp. LEGE 07298]